jgi:glycerate 2-kinase
VGKWDRAIDSDRVRRVLDREPVPALPAELDATTDPLAVESTTLDDEYHPHLHHEHRAPKPPYTVTDEVRKLGHSTADEAHSPEADRPRRQRRRRHEKETEMKVLIAPDKFKRQPDRCPGRPPPGSGLEQRGVRYHGLPLADGGDGSVAAAVAAGFRPIEVEVAAATGERHTATIAFDGVTAVVEVANTCGLHTLPVGTLAPLTSSSAGLGEAVEAALRWGAKRIVLALGGSASTDGGTGMLEALGAVFRDEAGRVVTADGGALRRIDTVDVTGLPDLAHIEIVIATDVQNPLMGPNGAAAVYGPQKGAGPAQVTALDAGLTQLVGRVAAAGHPTAPQLAAAPGAGAAGGLGFAGLLLGGHAVSGADFFLDLLQFNGKLPAIVARRAAPTPVVAVVGRSDLSNGARRRMGLSAVHAIADHTDGNPADDPRLSARLLEELGRTFPLTGEGQEKATPWASGSSSE